MRGSLHQSLHTITYPWCKNVACPSLDVCTYMFGTRTFHTPVIILCLRHNLECLYICVGFLMPCAKLTHTHIHIHTHTFMHTHTHTHTHTHACRFSHAKRQDNNTLTPHSRIYVHTHTHWLPYFFPNSQQTGIRGRPRSGPYRAHGRCTQEGRGRGFVLVNQSAAHFFSFCNSDWVVWYLYYMLIREWNIFKRIRDKFCLVINTVI